MRTTLPKRVSRYQSSSGRSLLTNILCPVVSEQWIVQSCLHGLLWGPTWGGFRVFPPPELEPQEIPNQRSANMGLDPHAVRTRTPEGLAAPPPQQAPPPNQGPARAPRPPSRQAVAPPIKKEYPPEIIDVDALSSSSGSEASDEEDEDTDLYETDDDHVPQSVHSCNVCRFTDKIPLCREISSPKEEGCSFSLATHPCYARPRTSPS